MSDHDETPDDSPDQVREPSRPQPEEPHAHNPASRSGRRVEDGPVRVLAVFAINDDDPFELHLRMEEPTAD